MQQIERVHANELDADGRLRRRFEIIEPENKSLGTKFAAALLLGNALLILKSVFFPSSPTQAKGAGRSQEENQQLASADTGQTGIGVENTEELPKQDEIDYGELIVDELELNMSGPVSSGTATSARVFEYGDTISVTVPEVPSTVPFVPLMPVGARAGQIGSSVVDFPTETGGPANAPGGSASAPLSAGLPGEVSDPAPRASDPDTAPGSAPDPEISGDSSGGGEATNDNPAPQMNRLPVVLGAATLPGVFINQSMLVGLLSLLQGTHDPDGDELEVSNLTTSSGTVTANADDTWTFTPDAYTVGEVTFTYQVGDDEGYVIQTASFNVSPIPGEEIVGTDASEFIVGTPGMDQIYAGDGDDTILAREDDDFVDAGDGNDRIVTGEGDDVIFAGGGDDIVYAGDGDDTVFGGEGDDQILGEAGDDTLLGEDGNDFILAGIGDDRAFGGEGDDLIFGEEGNDLLDGGAGSDEISAGVGEDLIIAGAGDDMAYGDEGNDVFIATVSDGDDYLDGGSGVDTVNFAATSADLVIDLEAGTAFGDETGTDQIFAIENVVGGAGNDTITGNAEQNVLEGGEGNDLFLATSADGDDFYDGGAGIDTISFASSETQTQIDLAGGTVQSSDTGNDIISNIENVVGSKNDDMITMSNAVNIVSGGGGNDVFIFDRDNSSGSGRGNRDIIEDFNIGDKLDFSGFTGTLETDGWERLTFIYDQAEFSGSGQIRYRYEEFDNLERTIIEIKADLERDNEEFDFDIDIELVGRHQFNFENLFT